MTILQIKQFIVAATCLNFTEAANALYLSPSSLSRQISSMERELNLQLFHRSSRSVRLTPAGEALLEDLTDVYDAYLRGVARAQGIQRGHSATLNIGILDGHVISGRFARVIGQMEQQHPDVAVDLFRGSFGDLTRALYDGSADLIVTLEFSLREKGQLKYLPLGHTRDYLVVPRSHPLAKKKIITAEDLGKEIFIGNSEEDSRHGYEQAERLRHITGCAVKSAPNLETYTLWIQAGLGISVVNSHNYLASDPELCFIDLKEINVEGLEPVNSDLVIAWNGDTLNPALPVFLDICQDNMTVATPPVPENLRTEADFA